MKTKRSKIVFGVTAGVIAAVVIVTTVILTGGNTIPPITDNPEVNEPIADVVVNPPSDNTPTPKKTVSDDPPKESSDLVIDVDGAPEPTLDDSSAPVAPPENPISEPPQTPALPIDNGNADGGIIIGDGGVNDTPYNCGAVNHKCEGPETHAFITNLELEGCKTCGSDSCQSFYALNPWGYTSYDPSKCPKYDIKKDPVLYCQDCGKKTGDGKNDTCAQFVNAANCPACGKYVPPWTCHSCS